MRSIPLPLIVLLMAAGLMAADASAQATPHSQASRQADGFEIAITVDDLPAHGALPQGMTRAGIAQSYIATLKRHGVRQAFGFVNAGLIEHEPRSAGVLTQWRQAGYPLGNHTYSHLNLDRATSLEAWEADVERGEPLVARQMPRGGWRWLRFPNLAGGSDPARHDGAAAYLAARGYRIADVSMSFSDWAYTDAYARCVAQGNDSAIAAMKADYLQGVDQGIAWMKATSMQVYGRIIPQVLLTHLGGWSAMMLPQVMARLDAAGARYVPLAKAEADPAYAKAQALPGGGDIMERFARANHREMPAITRPTIPANLDTVCR